MSQAVLSGGMDFQGHFQGLSDSGKPDNTLIQRFGVWLAWSFLRLESPAWQWVIFHHKRLFPQWSDTRPGQSLRLLLQCLWLVGAAPVTARRRPDVGERTALLTSRLIAVWRKGCALLPELPMPTLLRDKIRRGAVPSWRPDHWVARGLGVLATLLALLCVTQPFDLRQQLLFVLLMVSLATVVRKIPGRFITLLLIVLSVIISSRYFWWRYTETLNWDNTLDISFGLLLLMAESYSWLVLILGYFQAIWPLDRQPYPLPDDIRQWPTVDVYIPTYNEDLGVVRATVLAAMGIDWPKDKLAIYILDDGKRESFRRFAAEVGVGYLIRDNNHHAKAGNLNAALQKTSGEFLAIFDCDHIPTNSFLQMTMGWFVKSPKLGVMQTPHHFLSPDPFERNLHNFKNIPNENTLFYGLVQNGNDMWDASFFCGSCAVLRRSALESIGGFAVETVTEDAHTSLRLHRHGWTSAYIRIPQAAGLATESLSAHVGQRIRWARGMVQIFRLDNPLFGKGLSFGQRLCYFNAMLHFLAGVPRLIYLTAPLAFLMLHAYILHAPAVLIVLFVLPHMILTSLTNSRIQGKYRHSFWSEIYETVLSWYIARPTTVALINPHKGKFNVTAKGGLIEENVFDWGISRSFVFLALLNLLGVLFGVWRYFWGPADEQWTVLISIFWTGCNLLILGGAIAVAAEMRQVRRAHRVELTLPAAIRLPDGHAYPCSLVDYSESGAGLALPLSLVIPADTPLKLLLCSRGEEFCFEVRVRNRRGNRVGVELESMAIQDHINFVQCTFARADTWAQWQESFPSDKPLHSLFSVMKVGLSGYKRMADYAPLAFRPLIRLMMWAVEFVMSFLPVNPAVPIRPVKVE